MHQSGGYLVSSPLAEGSMPMPQMVAATGNAISGHPKRPRDICRHWARGYCNRGPMCGFFHAGPSPNPELSRKPMPHSADSIEDPTYVNTIKSTVPCKDNSVGKCNRGDKCKFSHSWGGSMVMDSYSIQAAPRSYPMPTSYHSMESVDMSEKMNTQQMQRYDMVDMSCGYSYSDMYNQQCQPQHAPEATRVPPPRQMPHVMQHCPYG